MREKMFSKWITFLASGICLLAFILLLIGAVGFGTQEADETQSVKRLNQVTWIAPDGEQSITLPYSFQPLSARTPVTITTEIRKQGGRLLSSKRTDLGTGTSSIISVAEKHGGGAEFEADGTVFKVSVYVQI